jgi:hypothetical protein
MATTFDTESEAQAVSAELNAAAERDVRYQVERYGKKWAIARQSKRTYWGWDEYLVNVVSPKPAQRNDVEAVRQIITLARGDGMEIVALMTLLETGNKNGISDSLSDAGAALAGIVVRNALFTRLITLITREYAKSREGDMHLGRAFELLEGDTLAIFQGVGSPDDLSAAIEDWKKLRGDQRLSSLVARFNNLSAHKVETDGSRLRPLGSDAMADRLLGILRHQTLELRFGLLVLKMGRPCPREDRRKRRPRVRRGHINDTDCLDPGLWRVDTEQGRVSPLSTQRQIFARP